MVLLITVVVAITVMAMTEVPFYLSADAGHYLADADATFGQGVRESRHLPGYPTLLASLRLLTNDLVAVALGMTVIVVLLILGFLVFIHGRVGNRTAELVGAAFFILAPVFAEGVGWHGAAMLLGLALSLMAMRSIDEVLTRPSPRRVFQAGVLTGLVGLSHPLALAILVQVTALVVAVLTLRAAAAAWRARSCGTAPAGVRRALALIVVGIAGAALIGKHFRFYTEVRPPVALAFDASRLTTLSRWAFRDDATLWIGLVAGGLLMLWLGRRLQNEPGYRLALWSTCLTLVPLANVLLTGGHESYTSRYLYVLPTPVGCTVAFGLAWLSRPFAPANNPVVKAMPLLLALTVGVAAVRLGQSYQRRLEIALPYYNTLTQGEREALGWLRGREGAVAVSAKGGDKVAGTLYAWMIEGLADVRAIGTGRSFLSVLDEARRDSLDIERVMSGSALIEMGPVRVSASEATARNPLEVDGLVDGDWESLFRYSAGPTGLEDLRPVVEAVASGTQVGALRVTDGGLEVTASPSGERDRNLTLNARHGAQDQRIAVDIDPPIFAGRIVLRAHANRASLVRTIGDRTVLIDIEAPSDATASVQNDARSGGARIHFDGAGTELVLRVSLHGIDTAQPAAAAYRDRDLLRRHQIRYLYTWRLTGIAPVLAARSCFRDAMNNDEVVVFEVVPECRR